jgi:hypothetical protein
MGYYLIYELNTLLVKHEMSDIKKSLSRHITRITIEKVSCNKDFRRIDRKEFIYKGNLYDLVCEAKHGNTTVFYCVRDHKEENLQAGFHKAFHSKLSLVLLDHVISMVLISDTRHGNFRITNELNFPVISPCLLPGVNRNLSPPPEFS